MKYLIYCTKAKPYLFRHIADYDDTWGDTHTDVCFSTSYAKDEYDEDIDQAVILNGTIVAEFECDKVEEIDGETDWLCRSLNQMIIFGDICEKACIDESDCYEYLNGKNGYAIHIKNLKAFDKPLELSELFTCNSKNVFKVTRVKKAPQNMMYVWYKGKKHCLISIRSPYVCDIMNGDKTIEVRKKVLKECL